jgi:hypothetical protein
MLRGSQWIASVCLSAALMAPLAALAMRAPQDDRDHDRQDQRVYDRDHRDYHNWDQQEDTVYRHWLEERHHAYVEYNRLREKDRRAYWKWRHEHQEHEEHEHH